MPVHADASAHFQIREIVVTLGDQDFAIPAIPAAGWLTILTEEELDVTKILPGLLSLDEQNKVDDLLLSGDLPVKELGEAVKDVITVASGHAWWWSLGLLSLVRSEQGTQMLGEMARIDAGSVSLAAWLNGLYALVVRYQKDQDRVEFDAQLDSPPAGVEVDPEDLIDEAASTSAFMAMMGNQNG